MEKIKHFNVNIQKNENNLLTRENYCKPTDELDYKEKKNIKNLNDFYKLHGRKPGLFPVPDYYFNIPNELFADEEHYTKEFVDSHYQNCMKNFDLNMNYFNSLDHDKFNISLNSFVKKNGFKEEFDLNNLNEVEGFYIIVLDKYNQVYIGMTNNIKKRILSHWSKKKHFSRLISGTVDNSILSIDSFGALDTTRIFYKKLNWYNDINKLEEKYIDSFNSKYVLNRVSGGLNGETDSTLRNMQLISNKRNRELNNG